MTNRWKREEALLKLTDSTLEALFASVRTELDEVEGEVGELAAAMATRELLKQYPDAGRAYFSNYGGREEGEPALIIRIEDGRGRKIYDVSDPDERPWEDQDRDRVNREVISALVASALDHYADFPRETPKGYKDSYHEDYRVLRVIP